MKLEKTVASARAFRRFFGGGEPYRVLTRELIENLPFPDVMKTIVRKKGLCSYLDQMFWTCDPRDWHNAIRGWFAEGEKSIVLARSAFGNLLVRQGDIYRYVRVHSSLVLTLGSDTDRLFSKTLTDADFSLTADVPDVERARKATGPLEWDEIYAYAPALALGGDSRTAKLIRVKAPEHLAMLAQLAPIQRL